MADARDRVDESHHTESRDRRRPGRIENASPHLVPLLRQQSAGSGTEAPTDLGSGDGSAESCEDDGIAASRGIVVGGIIGAAMWGAIAAAVCLVLRRVHG